MTLLFIIRCPITYIWTGNRLYAEMDKLLDRGEGVFYNE